MGDGSGPSRWDTRCGGPMQLRLSDPSYTDRLAHFLRSLGQTVLEVAPNQLEVDTPYSELEIYLRVWGVLYPDTDVQAAGSGADEAPGLEAGRRGEALAARRGDGVERRADGHAAAHVHGDVEHLRA